MSELLERFRTAYRNLQLLPLLKKEELEKFYVPYAINVIEELEQVVEDCFDTNNKIIFTGHRGCGKSTLLGRFAERMSDRFFVVFFSISDLIEMSDINHINILFAIAVQMMAEAEQQQINIAESTKLSLYEWFATKTQTEVETPLKAELSAGFNLFNLIKGKLQSDAFMRRELKQEFERKTTELVARLDEIAAIIQQAIGKEILVIIDDIDKIDLKVVREIFHDNVKMLFKPTMRIIFSIPIATLREIDIRRHLESETSNQIHVMPVAKLYPKPDINNREKEVEPRRETLKTFSDILYERIDPEIIDRDAVETIMLKSGGVLRELIRIASVCCTKCLLEIRRDKSRDDIRINAEILDKALTDIRNDFATPLSKRHYDILVKTYRELQQNTENDEELEKFRALLHGLYILEYRNADQWYDIHPIVYDLLKRKGLFLT
ncbi:P-loop NTPase fold protein [Spirulina sp. 06S082]|uniref:P-loop NTPase fold protein n=1 Tax=Spirulina sp. 06S082 TaxID=3110248 RepID=UPI002B1F567E|nr:P-loop NTPase fold protein [Spirulina sp. 06S082]MEA5469510.1 P-loop NTPase fold protein [Spirulina sp. 06S082]